MANPEKESHTMKRSWDEQQKLFVENSEAIAGQSGPIDGSMHLQLARILNKKGVRFVHPQIINLELTGRQSGWYRAGTESILIGRVPDHTAIPALVDELAQRVQQGIETLNDASYREKSRFAWVMHFELMCMLPFVGQNGRTARLMMNHIRTMLGLPVLVIANRYAGLYHWLFQQYRENMFIPKLRKMDCAA